MKKKKKYLSVVFIIIILSVVTLGIYVVKIYSETDKPKNKSAFDASVLEDTEEEKENSSIYEKSSSDADVDISNEDLSEYLRNNTEYSEKFEKIYDIISKVSDTETSAAEDLINRQAVSSRGYKSDRDMIKKYREKYISLCGTEKFALLPYKFIDFDAFSYCMIKLVPEKSYSNGERGYDYSKAEIETYTVYQNGTFLPFGINEINNANILGIHKNNITFEDSEK